MADVENLHGWAKGIQETWLDQKSMIRTEALASRGWEALPVVDFPNIMESEWLAEAVSAATKKQTIGLSFEYHHDADLTLLETSRDAIFRFWNDSSYKYAIITNENEDFLHYKDQNNRYCIICGNRVFIDNAFKCTRDTAKIMYFDYGVENSINIEREKNFMENIWKKYT